MLYKMMHRVYIRRVAADESPHKERIPPYNDVIVRCHAQNDVSFGFRDGHDHVRLVHDGQLVPEHPVLLTISKAAPFRLCSKEIPEAKYRLGVINDARRRKTLAYQAQVLVG